MPIRAQRNDEIEEKRDRDEADRLDRAHRAMAADQRRQRAADVNGVGDRRVRDVETRHVGPGPRQLPEGEIIVALKSEDRESRRVESDRRRRPNAEQRSAAKAPVPPRPRGPRRSNFARSAKQRSRPRRTARPSAQTPGPSVARARPSGSSSSFPPRLAHRTCACNSPRRCAESRRRAPMRQSACDAAVLRRWVVVRCGRA